MAGGTACLPSVVYCTLSAKEKRVDIDRNIGRGSQRIFQLRRLAVVLRKPGFGARPVARSFDFEQLLRQPRQRPGIFVMSIA